MHPPLYAEPVIQEFLAANQSIAPDNCDFEDYSDWIELYNPAATNVSLANHYLTDDLSQPFKWLIPASASIPPNGYLVFRADGYNAGPGETHVRGYYPWGSTFQTRRYHAGFKLNAGGESIGLYRTLLPPQELTCIALGALWRFRDTGTDPGPEWMTLTYVDSGWSQGAAQLGYGDGDETTVVGYGPDSNNKYATTYFRCHFNVTDPSRLGNIRCRVLVDDSAIIYLNGMEVTRLRMPSGVVTYQDYSGQTVPSENVYDMVELSAGLFRAGDNVLAVEVHQASGTSSDLSFDAELLASEITGTPILVDSVTFGPQTTDVSYGRDAASTNGWSFFGEPTPGAANATEPLTQLSPASAVIASLASGFYETAQSVNLSSGMAATIHYTLDGSVPSSGSPLYSNALAIDATTILRARAFVPGWIPGPILTRSYFVGADATPNLPVFSFVADPITLFDNTIGIYDNDSPYPYKGREVPIRLEFFEADATPAFRVNAGARIAGENIWLKAQKPFNVYLRSKYGDDAISYQLFPDQPVATFGEIMLRNGGDDWEETLLRDAMMPSICEGQMDAELYSYRPSILFLNGEFWGIYNIRKRFDPVYFASEHYLPEGEYDLVQWAHVGTSTVVLNADIGSTDAYEAFRAFCTTNDPADSTIFSQIQEIMNIDSFIDYVVATDFAVNTSWSHNREFWCGHAPGSKWQWIVNDFDRGFDTANLSGSIIDDFRNSYTLFQRLDNNTNFVNRLIQRYAAHLGSTLLPQRITDKLDLLAAEQEGEIQRHIARWSASGGIASLATRQAQLNEIKQFAVDRPAYAVSRLQTELGLSLGMANLTINIAPSTGGQVRVAGVPMTPEYTNTLRLFLNTPVELSAEPAPGYAFAGWSNGSTNSTVEVALASATSITASFVAGAETVLPATLSADTILTAGNSPYTLNGDMIVQAGTTLTIEPGVNFRLPGKASIYVHGALIVNGTSNAPVEFSSRNGLPWGNISVVDATGSSVISNAILRGATVSRKDPLNLKAAVSGLNSSITLDHVDIEAPLPVFARYGSTTLRECRIHSLFTGDGVNVKSGNGLVEYCTFTGEATPDTDAIDFDSVVNGIIRGNRIYAFRGSNSDAIDVGEGCVNLLVVSNRIFNIYDKGVSVGQASTAWIQRNLIVDCDMGVGIKDAESTGYIDQNTFARNNRGVAVYEKNVGSGGGIAFVTNCIFSRSKDEPVFVDSLSSLTVDYSLSDTLPLSGTGNLLTDPLFTDAGSYDFSLSPSSPAIDSGDPAHALDGDGTRADMGAYYIYDPTDYPYLIPNVVVINEVLAHSHDVAPDWIELFNNSSQAMDLGGWFLSDDPDVPQKYRIADGTILAGNGYLVFYEDLDFGLESVDPGALIPFALSENGDTVNVFGPSDGFRPDYSEHETFGASLRGVTKGRYYKKSTRTYNFVSLATPTPGGANSAPLTGPVVISEIMYHPPNVEAEYIELTNIETNSVSLFDTDVSEPWRMTQGINYVFPSAVPIIMEPGEKILLVRNSAAFALEYGTPLNTRVFQWDSGVLDNGGETLELSLPGDVDDLGVRQFVRIDRVDYSDSAPWPTGPDGSGTSLARINERAYGNDVANWTESAASPGQTSFERWANDQSLPAGQDGPNDNPDGDRLSNAAEYGCGTDPWQATTLQWTLDRTGGTWVSFVIPYPRQDVGYVLQKATSSDLRVWTNLDYSVTPGAGESVALTASDPNPENGGFYRLLILLFNQY